MTLLNEVEGDSCETSGSRCRGLVGCLKSFVGHAVLVYVFGCLIPILQRSVGWASISHRGHGVLDLRIQSFSELYHNDFQVCVPCFCH